MKRTLLTLVNALFAVAAWSASYDIVSVDLTDGSKVDIALSDKLSLSFNATHLQVTGTNADFEIPKEKIVAFSHSDSSGLDEIAIKPSVDFVDRMMCFTGLADGSIITIHNISGKCIRSIKTEGECQLGLEDLPAGVYIVAVNNVSYKISLK